MQDEKIEIWVSAALPLALEEASFQVPVRRRSLERSLQLFSSEAGLNEQDVFVTSFRHTPLQITFSDQKSFFDHYAFNIGLSFVVGALSLLKSYLHIGQYLHSMSSGGDFQLGALRGAERQGRNPGGAGRRWGVAHLSHWPIGPLAHWPMGPLAHWPIGPLA